jgi:mannosyltransferase OCH1-like enzyme
MLKNGPRSVSSDENIRELQCNGQSLNVQAVSPFDHKRLISALHQQIDQSIDPHLESTILMRNKSNIPRIIMQTWKNCDIPDHWKESPISIRETMPDWTYVLMTDEDNNRFCKTHFPDFWPYFRDLKHNIQRADAIRYMWLYMYGGIYIDMDMVIVKSLDKLFVDDTMLYLCTSGNITSCITNSFMASKPKCPIWLRMIEHMKQDPPWWAYGKHMEVMNTTGPVALNYVVKTSEHPYMTIPSKMVMPCSVCDLDRYGTCDIGDSYLSPLVGSSWVAWDSRVYNFFMCNWKTIILCIVIFIILLFIILILWLIIRNNTVTYRDGDILSTTMST